MTYSDNPGNIQESAGNSDYECTLIESSSISDDYMTTTLDLIKHPPIQETNDNFRQNNVVLIPISWLKAHEQCSFNRFVEVFIEISLAGGYHWPIVIDSKTGVILDGHHRFRVATELGLDFIPGVLIDYLSDDRITVSVWDTDRQLSSHHNWDNETNELTNTTECRPSSTTVSCRATCTHDDNTLNAQNDNESQSLSRHLSSVSLFDPYIFSNETNPLQQCQRIDSLWAYDILKNKPPSHLSITKEELFVELTKNMSTYKQFINPSNLNVFHSSSSPGQITPTILTKEHVISMGLSNNLFRPKSTRHALSQQLYCDSIFYSFDQLR